VARWLLHERPIASESFFCPGFLPQRWRSWPRQQKRCWAWRSFLEYCLVQSRMGERRAGGALRRRDDPVIAKRSCLVSRLAPVSTNRTAARATEITPFMFDRLSFQESFEPACQDLGLGTRDPDQPGQKPTTGLAPRVSPFVAAQEDRYLDPIRANQTRPLRFARPSRKVTKCSGTIPLPRVPSRCIAQMP